MSATLDVVNGCGSITACATELEFTHIHRHYNSLNTMKRTGNANTNPRKSIFDTLTLSHSDLLIIYADPFVDSFWVVVHLSKG